MLEDTTGSVVEGTSEPEVEEVVTDQSETEVETLESEESEEVLEDEESETEEDQAEDEQSETEPTVVKIDYDGVEYDDVAPALKDAFMRNKDYTEKTQALSVTRQEHEAKVEDFTQYVQATIAQSENMARLASNDAKLQEYNVDWNGFFEADPAAATKAHFQLQQLERQREGLVGEIQTSEKNRQKQAGVQKMRTAAATDAQLSKELPNWNKEHKATLGKFAVETMGIPVSAIANAVSPAEMKIIHYAEIGYRLSNKVKVDQKAAGKPKVEIKPSVGLKPKRQSAPKTLSNVSDPEQYRKMRMAQKQRAKA